MFLDMINALQVLKKDTMSTRLSQALEPEMSAKNIIAMAVKWIETHYGETPIKRTDKPIEALQTIRRKKEEDITNFIQRFEGVMEKLRVVRFELEERFEAALLHRAANMSKPEANNISSQVDMGSSKAGLLGKLKVALRKIGFCKNIEGKSEEVVLQCNIYEDSQDDGVEDAYYGEYYGGNNQGQNRRFQNQNQSGNQFQNQSGNQF